MSGLAFRDLLHLFVTPESLGLPPKSFCPESPRKRILQDLPQFLGLPFGAAALMLKEGPLSIRLPCNEPVLRMRKLNKQIPGHI